MKYHLASIFTFLVIVGLCSKLQAEKPVPVQTSVLFQPFIRSVVIETENKRGSGIIVRQGLVLTAFHNLETDSETTVNGKVARVVAVDTLHDFALLEILTHEVPPIEFAENVALDEEIISMTNPIGHTNLTIRGRIIDFDDGKLFTDMRIHFGSSGGGVYNLKGKFIGMAEAMQVSNVGGVVSYVYGIITPAPVVAKFLLHYELRLQGKEPPNEEPPPQEEAPKKAATARKKVK